MLKLYGFAVSNYFNMVKFALELKGIEYEVVTMYPNQDDEFLQKSPMGKVPVLETEQGCLVETNIILEFLDNYYPENPLYPGDAFQNAKVKEVVKLIELYLELPARRCYAEAFFGGKVSDEVKQDTQRSLLKGIKSLAKVSSFSPYLLGAKLTAADIMFLYSLDLASVVHGKLFNLDLFAELPQAKALFEQLSQHPIAIKIADDKRTASEAFYKYVAGNK